MDEQLEKSRYGKVVAVEEKLSRIYLDRYGREIPDPTPVAPPVGYKKQPSMVDHVRALVAADLSRRAEQMGYESFEESNDFDIGDDFEPETEYERMGIEGELGALPPEVATWPKERRQAFFEGRYRAYEESLAKDREAASSRKSPPAAAGGREPSQNGAPSTPSTTQQTSPASSPDTDPAGNAGPTQSK